MESAVLCRPTADPTEIPVSEAEVHSVMFDVRHETDLVRHLIEGTTGLRTLPRDAESRGAVFPGRASSSGPGLF